MRSVATMGGIQALTRLGQNLVGRRAAASGNLSDDFANGRHTSDESPEGTARRTMGSQSNTERNDAEGIVKSPGDPVDPITGSFFAKQTDFILPDIAGDFRLMRRHQSVSNYEKQLRQAYSTKSKLIEEIDSLDPDDRHYSRRKSDLDDRLYKMYDKIEDTESLLIAARAKKQAIEAEKLTGDNIL